MKRWYWKLPQEFFDLRESIEQRLARFTMAAGALRTLAEKAPKVGLIEIPVE